MFTPDSFFVNLQSGTYFTEWQSCWIMLFSHAKHSL